MIDEKLLKERLKQEYPSSSDPAIGNTFFKIEDGYVKKYHSDVWCDRDTRVKIEPNDTIESIVQKFKDGKVEVMSYHEWSLD